MLLALDNIFIKTLIIYGLCEELLKNHGMRRTSRSVSDDE
jgi:hypothetical protein